MYGGVIFMSVSYIIIGILSFFLTLCGAFLILKFFPRFGLLDRPEQFGYARAPVPYGAGILFFFVFCILAIFFFPLHDWKLIGLLLAAFLLSIVSFIDDFRSLSPFFRLGVHIVSGVLLVLFGISIIGIRNPFGDFVVFGPIIGAVATVLWVVLFTNTMNWLDGVPGVVPSISAVASFVMFLLAIRPDFHTIDQTSVAGLAIIVFGMSLAFTFFNISPPKMLMGDSGSIFLGFMIAALAIFSGGKLATAFLVLGVPILDAFWSILRRLFHGRAPWKGDLKHLHHRFLELGFSERQVVFLYVFLSALFGSIALLTGTVAKLTAGLALLVLLFLLALFLAIYQRKAK